MWLVSIMILWLATLALLYVTNADIAASRDVAQQERARATTATTKWEEEFNRFKALSDVVGYSAADIAARTNIAALELDLTAAKAAVGNALGGAEARVTVDQSLKALMASLQAAKAAKAAAESARETEANARGQADSRVAALESQYKAQIAQLRQDLTDEQNRGSTQATNYDRQLADLRNQQQSADDSARAAQRALDEAQLAATRAAAVADQQIAKLAVKRAPIEPEQPDGEVLAVSADGTVAWIDIGSRQSLRPGTRFEVLRRGRSGELQTRGTLEVREVEPDMATTGLIGAADVYDPILPGDLVRNPHFHRGESMHFYLLGEFPLSLSKEFVTQRLDALGAQVDSQLGTGTDVLVLGGKNLADGEFAVELDQTPEYLLADRLGMRIMRLDDLSNYLRF